MAVNTLCRAFRCMTLTRQSHTAVRYSSTQLSRNPQNVSSISLNNFNGSSCSAQSEVQIKFKPGTLNIDFGIPATNGIIGRIIEMPFRKIPSMEDPLKRSPLQEDLPLTDKSLELPTLENIVEKHAVRLIVIRRKKMKKHRRKKWRKKMEHMWARVRKIRNIKKEKALQALLVGKIQEAEKFNAEEYVAERISKLKHEFVQRTWRGEILPTHMIKQFIEEKRKKQEAKRNKPRLTL